MKNNNELVLKTNNEIDFNITRVNFEDPSTILNYGIEILSEIQQLAKIHAQMLESQKETSNIDEEIKNINKFSDQLEENNTNETKSKGIMKFAIKKYDKIKNMVKKQNNDQNFTKYQQYCENLERIAQNVEEDKNKTINEININNEFIKKMKPLIEQLEKLITIGYNDLENYKNNTFTLLTQAYNNNPEDINAKYNYLKNKQAIEVFERQLTDLNKSLISYKQTLLQIEMSQGPNFELILSYNSYLKTTNPNLHIQGSSMLGLQRQKTRIDKFQNLVDVANNTYIKNAEMLLDNIENATQFAENGNILMDTIKTVDEITSKGVALLTESVQKRKQMRKEEIIALKKLSSNVDSYKQQIGNYLQMETETIKALNTEEYKPNIRKKLK